MLHTLAEIPLALVGAFILLCIACWAIWFIVAVGKAWLSPIVARWKVWRVVLYVAALIQMMWMAVNSQSHGHPSNLEILLSIGPLSLVFVIDWIVRVSKGEIEP
jgi:hypothetical protein